MFLSRQFVILFGTSGGGGDDGSSIHILKLLFNDSTIANDKCALILFSLSPSASPYTVVNVRFDEHSFYKFIRSILLVHSLS